MKKADYGVIQRWLILTGLGIGLLGWTGVGLATNERIGILLADDTTYFYQEVIRGLSEEARAVNMRLEIISSRWDAEEQGSQAEKLLTEKLDALIVAPCDSKRVGTIITQANEIGLPVITLVNPNRSSVGNVVAHITSDDRAGGRLAGQRLAEAMNGRGKVVIINQPRIPAAVESVAGFREALQEFPEMEIAADIPAWGLRERARAIVEDLTVMMPEMAGIFAVTNQLALGAIDGLEQAGLSKTIPIVGYGGSDEIRKKVDQGKLQGTVVQYPREMGRLAIRAVRRHLTGGKLPATMVVKTKSYSL